MGACNGGGVSAGNCACSVIFCGVEQLNMQVTKTSATRRRIGNLRNRPERRIGIGTLSISAADSANRPLFWLRTAAWLDQANSPAFSDAIACDRLVNRHTISAVRGLRDMNETVSAESIGRRLDGLQNNVSGLNRRMVTLESNLIDRVGALEARMAGLEDRADQLVDRISALETSVNSLILLVERIAKRGPLDR
jgi:hypothetical protein